MNLASVNGIEQYNYLVGKNLEQLTIQELNVIHLQYRDEVVSVNGRYLTSCLHDLTQTLSASFINRRTAQYVPLMTSFAILDQIGSLYHIQGQNPNATNGIKRALQSFTAMNADEIEDLVTLRHGLFHDGSLTSRNQYTGTDVIFRMATETNVVIQRPAVAWNGVYDDDLTNHITLINLKQFQSLVLTVLDKCLNELEQGRLSCTISDCREFYYKFLFSRPRS